MAMERPTRKIWSLVGQPSPFHHVVRHKTPSDINVNLILRGGAIYPIPVGALTALLSLSLVLSASSAWILAISARSTAIWVSISCCCFVILQRSNQYLLRHLIVLSVLDLLIKGLDFCRCTALRSAVTRATAGDWNWWGRNCIRHYYSSEIQEWNNAYRRTDINL